MKIDSVYKDAAKVSAVIFILGLVEFILFSAFYALKLSIFLGVLYGCAFSSLNFFYLAYCVKQSVERDAKAAKAYMSSTYSTRLILTAAMIIIATKVEAIHLWAAVIPLLFPRIAVFVVNFIINKGREKS